MTTTQRHAMLRAVETTYADRHRPSAARATRTRSYAAPPVFVVADGMGGAQAGEVASRDRGRDVRAGSARRGDSGAAPRRRSCRTRTGRSTSSRTPSDEHAGMGTTLTAAYLEDDHVAIAHVGDSRAYMFRDGELVRLTQDHSLVDELVEGGQAHRGAGGRASSALDHHAGAGTRAGGRRSTHGATRRERVTCCCSAATGSRR